jgi:replicative DNA helicase Mcm
MEQGSISIAKANIVATLPAQTAVLGGGNPKFGRFDPFMPIKEQIDVPETLLTRFDLKFALRDIPNPEQDARVAEHILKSRHFDEESAIPAIDSNLLKKYIAYARKKIHPKLTREVGKILTDFFVKLRGQIAGEEAPVAITLRQYEALIRMTESSAKIQLRETVTMEDAMRAINLMKVSLRDFGLDQETGQFDIDRAEGHVTATQRSRIRTVLDIISELENIFGKNVPLDEIRKRANQQNISNIDDLIRKMVDEGVAFEPSIGIIKRI